MVNLNIDAHKSDDNDFTSSMGDASPIKYAVLPKNLNLSESNVSLNVVKTFGSVQKKPKEKDSNM